MKFMYSVTVTQKDINMFNYGDLNGTGVQISGPLNVIEILKFPCLLVENHTTDLELSLKPLVCPSVLRIFKFYSILVRILYVRISKSWRSILINIIQVISTLYET